MLHEEPLERRKCTINNTDALWGDLTLAQKFAASSLIQFGYELSFIRDHYCAHVAILTCNENIAIISKAEEINTHPTIKIRT